MSRLGKKPIQIPNNVKVAIQDGIISIEGPKGKLEHTLPTPMEVEVSNNQIVVRRPSDSKTDMSLHGLTRTIISNMIKGTTDGYKKELEIRGVGYKAQAQGQRLTMNLGFSHQVDYPVPDGITVKTPKPTITEIRDFYKPEPYKGKGVRYAGEYVRHKAGKTVA